MSQATSSLLVFPEHPSPFPSGVTPSPPSVVVLGPNYVRTFLMGLFRLTHSEPLPVRLRSSCVAAAHDVKVVRSEVALVGRGRNGRLVVFVPGGAVDFPLDRVLYDMAIFRDSDAETTENDSNTNNSSSSNSNDVTTMTKATTEPDSSSSSSSWAHDEERVWAMASVMEQYMRLYARAATELPDRELAELWSRALFDYEGKAVPAVMEAVLRTLRDEDTSGAVDFGPFLRQLNGDTVSQGFTVPVHFGSGDVATTSSSIALRALQQQQPQQQSTDVAVATTTTNTNTGGSGGSASPSLSEAIALDPACWPRFPPSPHHLLLVQTLHYELLGDLAPDGQTRVAWGALRSLVQTLLPPEGGSVGWGDDLVLFARKLVADTARQALRQRGLVLRAENELPPALRQYAAAQGGTLVVQPRGMWRFWLRDGVRRIRALWNQSWEC